MNINEVKDEDLCVTQETTGFEEKDRNCRNYFHELQ